MLEEFGRSVRLLDSPSWLRVLSELCGRLP